MAWQDGPHSTTKTLKRQFYHLEILQEHKVVSVLVCSCFLATMTLTCGYLSTLSDLKVVIETIKLLALKQLVELLYEKKKK